MKPNPPTDKETLLRRATLDLIGMPPTTDELRAFLADDSPEAFAKVVDRLVASPHYGERWGRHWLDTARYADTGGSQVRLDNPDFRFAFGWVYRDYVIDAFNTDKPYDRFIIEQLAADKLPLGEDKTALAALGFITVGERFNDGNDTLNERIDAVGKGFLGLTVSCARCHDHKFDPISMEDYYALFGIFKNTVEPRHKPVIGKPNQHTADYLARIAAADEKNRKIYYDHIDKDAPAFRKKPATYALALRYWGLNTDDPEVLRKRQQSVEKGGLDEKFFAPSRWFFNAMHRDDPVFGPLARFAALKPEEFATKGKALAVEIAANVPFMRDWGHFLPPTVRGYNPRIAALFQTPPQSLEDVEARYNKLFAGLDKEFQAYLTARKKASTRDLPDHKADLVELLDIPFPIMSTCEIDAEALKRYVAELPVPFVAKGLPFEHADLNFLDLTHPGALKRAMTVEDVPHPVDAHILIRGQEGVKGSVVPRRFLAALSGPERKVFKDGSGRLELARAIASRENPLTARVAVNRAWMHHFGEGIVPTPEDLGVQSEKPSHPLLLDWLACYFMENGWSFKKLHRAIMLSSAYQQSSRGNPEYTKLDPGNRRLWRANVRRLEFEALRDSLLVFSGKLDPKVGGQPINFTDEPFSYRRSVYGYVDRSGLPELLQQFDFSDPRSPTSKRATTVVPQQALFFMNSPFVVEVARQIVRRKEFTSQQDDTARIAALYEIIYQRKPRAEETKSALAYLDEVKQLLAGQPAKVEVAPEDLPQPWQRRHDYTDWRAPIENKGPFVERRPLSAWEQYAQALLFANDVVFVK